MTRPTTSPLRATTGTPLTWRSTISRATSPTVASGNTAGGWRSIRSAAVRTSGSLSAGGATQSS